MNISSDKVHISGEGKEIFLDRNGIENVLWEKIILLYKKNPFSEVLLLNGPGGFTNLRVWTLCLNLLNSLLGNKIKIYNRTKVALYKYLYKKWIIPRYVIFFIWQRNNTWKYDLKSDKYIVCPLDAVGDCTLDYVKSHYWKSNKNMIKFSIKESFLLIEIFKKKHKISLSEFKNKPVYHVNPEYMMNPLKE